MLVVEVGVVVIVVMYVVCVCSVYSSYVFGDYMCSYSCVVLVGLCGVWLIVLCLCSGLLFPGVCRLSLSMLSMCLQCALVCV